MNISSFIKRHPVPTFFTLTFAISWGVMLSVIGGPGGFPASPEQFKVLLPFVVLALMAGPSITGILLTGLVSGKMGLRELLSRLLRWRVDIRWYAAALLTAPFLATVVHFMLSLLSPVFLPAIVTTDNRASLLLSSVAFGLMGGFLEELGWTGFAIPRLKLRYSIIGTGLIMGVLWGAWHFVVYFWGSRNISGGLSLAYFFPPYYFIVVGQLTAYRVLMVWVYNRTESLLVAMLMHASLTFCSLVFADVTTGVSFLTSLFVWTAALWVAVAVVAVTNHGHLSRQTLQRQADSKE